MEAAASAIAFFELGLRIVKLVQLWREIEDLPEDLRSTLEHLELIRPVLDHIQSEFQRHPQLAARSYARQCVENARAAEQQLKAIADKLHGGITKHRRKLGRKFGLLRAVFGEDEVARLQKRLDRALGVVGLCVDCFRLAVDQVSEERIIKDTSTAVLSRTQTLVEASEERIVRRVALELASQLHKNSFNSKVKPTQEVALEETEYTVVKSHNHGLKLASYAPSAFGRFFVDASKKAGRWNLFLQTPSWMSPEARSWEFQAQRAIAGWNFSLRSYSVRPQDAHVFSVVVSGDVSTMLSLFRSGQASLYDRDSEGASLLHYAAEKGQVDVCRKLLELGLTESIDENHPGRTRSPLDELIYLHAHEGPHNQDRRLLDLFLQYRSSIASLDVAKLFDYLGDWALEDDCLRAFQGWFIPEYHGMPLRARADAVRRACFSEVQSPNTVLFLLDRDRDRALSAENVDGSAAVGASVVHSAAVALGLRCARDVMPSSQRPSIWGRSCNSSWEALVGQVATAAAEGTLHGVELVEPCHDFDVVPWRGTPLISVIGSALCFLRTSARSKMHCWDLVLQGTVRSWVEQLCDYDIDLPRYGEGEKVAFYLGHGEFDVESLVKHERWMKTNWSRSHISSVPIRLTALEYGPEPSDWRVWWAPEYEAFAGQFWEVVNNPPEVMPGTWLE